MNNVKCAVLNVGGWYDAEDPMGPFHIYRAVEKNNPEAVNLLVMGPWSSRRMVARRRRQIGQRQLRRKDSRYSFASRFNSLSLCST